jgi:hypothetical protein
MKLPNDLIRRGVPALLAGALLLAAMPTPTQATTVRRLALPEMVQRAGNVVLARALENRVRTDPATHHHFTVTRFEVLDSAKGPMRPGEIFEVEIIGGQAPDSIYATVVAGAPRFRLDEEVVLFTTPGAGNRKQLVGFFLGAVRIQKVNGRHLLIAPPSDFTPEIQATATARQTGLRRAGATPAPLITVDSDRQARAAAAPPGREPVAVADFLDRVRALHTASQGEQP